MNVLFLLLSVAALAGACSPARNVPANASRESAVSSSGSSAGASSSEADMNEGARSRAPARAVVVYSSEREQLHAHALDAQTGELTRVSTVSLPQPVHYAAADAAARFLYVSASDGAHEHGLFAFRIDPKTGTLAAHGQPLVPPLGRIIHLSVDPAAGYLVLAHNRAAELSSVELAADGSLAGFVEQVAPARTGFFAHQALIDPTGTGLIACGLGAAPSAAAPEQPGSLSVFRFREGQLTQQQTLLPGPGLGPRHLDYLGDRVFVAMERGNRLQSYRYRGGVLDERPEFDVSTLANAADAREGQRAGAIHVHPDGKRVYLSNRAVRTSAVTLAGQPVEVFAGGENDVAVFELEPGAGAPRRVAHFASRGFEPRTFTIEPSGRFLIVANQSERNVLDASGTLRAVPRSVVVFEIVEGGALTFLREYEFTGGELFWIGSVQLPG